MNADEHRLLEHLAYEAWLRRGQPTGSPEVDWEEALKTFVDLQGNTEADLPPAPGSMPTDLGAEPVPELSHDAPGERRRKN